MKLLWKVTLAVAVVLALSTGTGSAQTTCTDLGEVVECQHIDTTLPRAVSTTVVTQPDDDKEPVATTPDGDEQPPYDEADSDLEATATVQPQGESMATNPPRRSAGPARVTQGTAVALTG